MSISSCARRGALDCSLHGSAGPPCRYPAFQKQVLAGRARPQAPRQALPTARCAACRRAGSRASAVQLVAPPGEQAGVRLDRVGALSVDGLPVEVVLHVARGDEVRRPVEQLRARRARTRIREHPWVSLAHTVTCKRGVHWS